MIGFVNRVGKPENGMFEVIIDGKFIGKVTTWTSGRAHKRRFVVDRAFERESDDTLGWDDLEAWVKECVGWK
jgi:hypothetical protein